MSAGVSRSIGTGNLGYGGIPSKTRTRPDLCAEHGHPGATYNPWMDRTWCLCGERIYEGNQHVHPACCGGVLVEDVA